MRGLRVINDLPERICGQRWRGENLSLVMGAKISLAVGAKMIHADRLVRYTPLKGIPYIIGLCIGWKPQTIK